MILVLLHTGRLRHALLTVRHTYTRENTAVVVIVEVAIRAFIGRLVLPLPLYLDLEGLKLAWQHAFDWNSHMNTRQLRAVQRRARLSAVRGAQRWRDLIGVELDRMQGLLVLAMLVSLRSLTVPFPVPY